MQEGQGMKEEVNRLWRRIGLDDLRLHLENVNSLAHGFEGALQALPTCSECARATLFEQIRETGSQLGSEVISLSALAETLKEAVAAAEALQSELVKNPPPPCRCEGNPCFCHSRR